MSLTSLPESPAILKRCTKCGIEKSVAEFGRASSRKDGLNPWCKACKAAYRNANHEKIIAYRKANREKEIAQKAAYYQANREKEIARAAAYRMANHEKISAYYQVNREKISARQIAYRRANYERRLAIEAAYRNANREKEAARHVAYYQANREKEIARKAAYYKDNPEKSREFKHKRRARELNASGTHTAQQVKDLLMKQGGKCVYCQSSIKKKYHVDHIIALANGGSNYISNIQLLCPTCNCSKSAKDPIEFAQQKGLLL